MTRLFHCYETHPHSDAQALKRMVAAQSSWEALYRNGAQSTPYSWPYLRDSSIIGDPRNLPFLKDVLAPGMAAAGDSDIVFWTNDDNHLHATLPAMLRMFCSIQGVCTSHRLDFAEHKLPDASMTSDEVAQTGLNHIGRDLFAATGAWLREHWNAMPDVILGAPIFDLHLATWIRYMKGFTTTQANFGTVIPCCELPKGYVWHQQHVSTWTTLPPSNPSVAHNYRLFRQWGEIYMPTLRFGPAGLI